MAAASPRIDERHAAHLAQQVAQLLRHYVPDWQEGEGGDDGDDGDAHSRALIAVFARFGELIIERLNRVPEKNLLAFLDMLGASRVPPQPARVPLTFRLADGVTASAQVPAGTQVATAGAAADGEPVIFETERPLLVTPARLVAAIAHDPATDRYTDLAPVLAGDVPAGLPAFDGDQPMPHEFYVGHGGMLALAPFDSLRVFLEFERAAAPVPLETCWDIWEGAAGIPLPAPSDGTRGLSIWGCVAFNQVPAIPPSSVAGVPGRWLRCRLTARALPAQLPGRITTLRLEGDTKRQGLLPEHALADAQALNLDQDFFPFGERPRFGATFYLASAMFGCASGSANRISLEIKVTDPRNYVTEVPGLQTLPATRPKPKLAWEAWDGERWTTLPAVDDGTEAFTRSGSVVLGNLPSPLSPRPSLLQGLEGCWLRVRITGGDYGREALQRTVTDPATRAVTVQVEPATLVPPSIAGITIDASLRVAATLLQVATHDRLVHRVFDYSAFEKGTHFRPFEVGTETHPALYLGFESPSGRERFGDGPVSLYADLASPAAGPAADRAAAPPHIVWEQHAAAGWAELIARDDTRALTRSGAIEWMPPADFDASTVLGERALHWIRVRWSDGSYRSPPRLQRLLLNTATAVQAVTLEDELLGSSDGGAGQRFRCARAPVVGRVQLQVREPERPSAVELEALQQALGTAPALDEADGGDRASEVWVPWAEVADFHACGPRDRHFVLDALRGELRFGDGRHGLVPPRGSGNLRLVRYRTGGGTRGNLPPGSITQLRTTLAYVDGVEQALPAEGGADAEPLAGLLERAPREMRHGGRAVTREDVEDVARLASPEVARVRCVPLWDALSTPLFVESASDDPRRPGHLTLILVPHSAEARPVPSQTLVERVREVLAARSLATAKFTVVGPRYVQIDVEADVVPLSPDAAGGLGVRVVRALEAFLHPLTGGHDGTGWPWGRLPKDSDFQRCIAAVPGVDHVRRLMSTNTPEVTGLTGTDHFLVHSGAHRVRLCAPESRAGA